MDGSLLQMSFKIRKGAVIWHRLCYIPCPVSFDFEELQEDSLDRIVERHLTESRSRINLRGVVRFDYDPSAEAEGHPSSHFTLNFDQTRVPVGRNFDPFRFLTFVDEHFISVRPNIPRFELAMGSDATTPALADTHRSAPHFNWFEA